MYVANGEESTLMEGGMAERGRARAVYTQIVNNQRDPALLEWVDGSTFKMRVFPLEGRQEKRILLAYTQRLSSLYGRSQYRFPAGHNLKSVDEWNFRALVKNGATLSATSPTHPVLKVDKQGDDLVLRDHAESAAVDKDVALDLSASAGAAPAGPATRFVGAELDGNNYVALRYRPDLPGRTERQRRDWVFLYESSADRDPLLARTQIDVLRHLLTNAEHDDTFNVLAAGTRVHPFRAESVPATAENVAAAVKFLEGSHLVGALDLGRALRSAAVVLKGAKNPHLVHLGSGLTTIGTPQGDLAELLPQGARYVGVGVGKRWNRAWMKEQAERTGGFFTQINPDETISWRAFDLLATLNTPRLLDVKVTAGDDAPRFLTDAATLAQGEELFAVTRFAAGEAPPKEVTVTGTLDGQPFRAVLPVNEVAGGAGYLPRTWAKWELDRMLIDFQHTGRNETKEEIVSLSKAMYVMTPFTSLLVLENDAMYEEFKVDRGRKDHWALYETPKKIKTFYDPLPNEVDVRNAPQGLKPRPNQVRPTVLVRVPPRFVTLGNGGPESSSRASSGRLTGGRRLLAVADETKPLSTAPAMFGDDEPDVYFTLPTPHYLDSDIRRNSPADRLGRLEDRLVERLQQEGLDESLGDLRKKSVRLKRLSESGLVAERAGVAQQFRSGNGRMPPFGFSPDGRLLTTGLSPEGEVRVWNTAAADTDGLRLGGVVDGTNNTLAFAPPALSLIVDGRSGLHSRGTESGEPLGVPPVDHFGRVRFGAGDAAPEQLAAEHMLMDGAAAKIRKLIENEETVRTKLELWKQDPGTPPAADFAFEGRLLQDRPAPALTYDRPHFTGDGLVYTDLLSYAPGLNTSRADLLAVLDEEAAPDLSQTPGTIDPQARKLIDRARQSGWQTLTLSAGEGKPGVLLTFDGAGRYAYERRGAFGLRERVVCDGKTLLHLYPELGLGARRTVTRFHRAELTGLVPWAVPPAADLARGCDLEHEGDRTVALVPHGVKERKTADGAPVPYVRYELVFAADGRLAERQMVLMGKKKTVLLREVYDGKGGVQLLDPDGKEVLTRKCDLAAATAPELSPETKDLVVLPLPLRTRAHTFHAADLEPSRNLSDEANGCFAYLEDDRVLALLATALAERRGDEARLLVQTHFFAKGDLRPGLFAVLASSGADLRHESALAEAATNRPESALLRYLVLGASDGYHYLLRRAPVHLAGGVAPADTFLGRLALARELTARWDVPPPRWVGPLERRTDVARTLAFVHDNRDSVLGWALLLHMQQRGRSREEDYLGMARAWEELATNPKRKQEIGDFRARYEQACCLSDGGKQKEARALFEELYDRALKTGGLPAVDSRFYNALFGKGGADDRWTPLARKTAERFIKEKRRSAVVYLAWQCQQLGDPTLAENLLDTALDGVTGDGDRLIVHLSAIDFLSHTGRTDRADRLISALLQEEKWRLEPALWRLAARLSAQRGDSEVSVRCLEQALDLEYGDLPEVINLQTWRNDYGTLLSHYRNLARQTTSTTAPLASEVRRGLAVRTIRAADRWRAHDPEASGACQTASEVLRLLGEEELAWEYLTTPNAMQPEQSSTVRSLATSLSNSGQFTLAEYAYEVAADADPKDPQLLWERAQNLRRAGQDAEADRWLKKLAESREGKDNTWEWRRVRERAEWELKRR
jgi:tetratricopeptide (TPR) repeat protein